MNELTLRLQEVMTNPEFETAVTEGRGDTFTQAIQRALQLGSASGSARDDGCSQRVTVEPWSDRRVPHLSVRALGPLEVWVDGELLTPASWRFSRPRELLVYLLTHAGGRSRNEIGLDFWPDASIAQVKNNVHVTLHHLRKAIKHADLVRFESGRVRCREV